MSQVIPQETGLVCRFTTQRPSITAYVQTIKTLQYMFSLSYSCIRDKGSPVSKMHGITGAAHPFSSAGDIFPCYGSLAGRSLQIISVVSSHHKINDGGSGRWIKIIPRKLKIHLSCLEKSSCVSRVTSKQMHGLDQLSPNQDPAWGRRREITSVPFHHTLTITGHGKPAVGRLPHQHMSNSHSLIYIGSWLFI